MAYPFQSGGYISSLMMTSSNGNLFRVTGHLCGEFTGPGEFPAQRPVTRSFDVLFICLWINDWVNNREAGDLRRYRAHYDVIVVLACFMAIFILQKSLAMVFRPTSMKFYTCKETIFYWTQYLDVRKRLIWVIYSYNDHDRQTQK